MHAAISSLVTGNKTNSHIANDPRNRYQAVLELDLALPAPQAIKAFWSWCIAKSFCRFPHDVGSEIAIPHITKFPNSFLSRNISFGFCYKLNYITPMRQVTASCL